MDSFSVKRRLSCILAADAVGFSRNMGRDELGTVRVLSAHRAVIDGIIAFHEGRIVGTAGDSVLAEFSSVVEAVRCAVEIQEAIKTRNDSLPDEQKLHFRVGINLGDVVVKENDLLGDGINVAARLETLAEPGGICISSGVYDQITGKLDLGFQDIGEQNLKNIARPIRVYRISGSRPVIPPEAPPPPPSRSPSRMRSRWVIGGASAGVAAVLAATIAWQSSPIRAPTPAGSPAQSLGTAPSLPAAGAAPASTAASPVAATAPGAAARVGTAPQSSPPVTSVAPKSAKASADPDESGDEDSIPARRSPPPVEQTIVRQWNSPRSPGGNGFQGRQAEIEFARTRPQALSARPPRSATGNDAIPVRPSNNSDSTMVWRRGPTGNVPPDQRRR